MSLSETAMDFLSPKNFPYPITKACTALPHLPAFSELPDGFLRIVLRIVQKINISRPFSEIFATRITIAEESGKSIDTVHRAVKWLEDNGFVERERKAKLGYRGSKSPLQPTQQFLETLEIVDSNGKPTTAKTASQDQHSHRSRMTGLSTELQGKNAQDCNDKPDQRQFARIGGVTIPIDLAWLCDKGVSPYGVLALMRDARAAKQKLSDIFQNSKKYLEGLTKREIYAYISKLIKSGKDFSNLSKNSEIEAKNQEISEYLARKTEDLEGRSFISKKSGAVFTVAAGVITEVRNGMRAVRFMTQSFIDAITEGRLSPHRGNS